MRFRFRCEGVNRQQSQNGRFQKAAEKSRPHGDGRDIGHPENQVARGGDVVVFDLGHHQQGQRGTGHETPAHDKGKCAVYTDEFQYEGTGSDPHAPDRGVGTDDAPPVLFGGHLVDPGFAPHPVHAAGKVHTKPKREPEPQRIIQGETDDEYTGQERPCKHGF